MELGVVKWFNKEKDFGFIVPETKEGEESKEIFFHYNDGQFIIVAKDSVVFSGSGRKF